MRAREDTINVQLGEVLQELRPTSWRVLAEHQRTLRNTTARPDILIEEPAGWPVVIEAERENHAAAETDARARLGEIVHQTGRPIESAVALVYPPDVREQTGGPQIRAALAASDALEYALYTDAAGGTVERLPSSGWLRGSARDLAMLIHRASVPAQHVQRLSDILEQGIRTAANRFMLRLPSRSPGLVGAEIAALLGQTDDEAGQTRRMAMTVLINALIFHAALSDSSFQVAQPLRGADGASRGVAPLSDFRADTDRFHLGELSDEWQRILNVNYWPIFAAARAILRRLPAATAGQVLGPLWDTATELVQGGVTRSHDLTGVIFQRLIADREFLATFYTRPEAAVLLASLALPPRGAPRGAEWGDLDSLREVQIADFACGTGTLLAAAYQRTSILHELHGGDPAALHGAMMQTGLVGVDVLNIAVHLTASMLASTHPETPFNGDSLLTMPYGALSDELDGERVAIGSLDLFADGIQAGLLRRATAVTSGGYAPEDVTDLMSRIGHGRFDVVIMNPPFTRQGGQEAELRGVANPAFAAFDTPPDVRDLMQARLLAVAGEQRLGNGNAGLASHFTDLALRKLRENGALAMVLPLSALSGSAWQKGRSAIADLCHDIVVVTIAAAGSGDRSFSADTGIAECLLIARKGKPESDRPRGTFVALRNRPRSEAWASEVGRAIDRARAVADDRAAPADDAAAIQEPMLAVGDDAIGQMIAARLPERGPWPIAGIRDFDLAVAASALEDGLLRLPAEPAAESMTLPIVPIGEIAGRGPYDLDIRGDQKDGSPRGPFQLVQPAYNAAPTYPMLWSHNSPAQRTLTVESDSEGQVKAFPQRQSEVDQKAEQVWATATRAHANRDLQFNANSLVVAMTDRPCIGGRAWPSVVFARRDDEYAFSLWCNSTLGLLLYWWSSNKSQSGRGTVTVTSIPNIPTLDTRALTDERHAAAREAFEAMRELRFLPFDQIDEDPARAELDRRLLVDVLGLPASLCEPDGPIDLLRRKLAREPQIHGGKKSRVVFTDDGEKSQRRHDRD